jgi:hypothetical protein
MRAFPFPWAAPAVLGALLVISAVTAERLSGSPLARLLRSPPMIFLGRLSYPLYLWHWPVYALFRWTVGLQRPAYMAVALALSVLFAYLSYTLLECPIRHGRWTHTQRKSLIVAGGFAAIVLCCGISGLAFIEQERLSMSVVMQNAAAWYPHPVTDHGDADGCHLAQTSEAIDGASIAIMQPRCAASMPSHPRLFVVGDSHAGAYAGMLSLLAARQGVEVDSYSYPGCAFANLLRPSDGNCRAFVRASASDISRKAKPGDVVFLTSLRMNRLSDQWGAFTAAQIADAQAEDEREPALAEAVDLIGEFDRKNLAVIIEAPKPIFKAPAFRCSDWFNAGNSVCRGGLTVDREELLRYRKPVMDSLAALSSQFPHLIVWDPFPVLCPESPCRAITAAGPLFFDGDHLSNFSNRLLYPYFLSALEKVWDQEAREEVSRR